MALPTINDVQFMEPILSNMLIGYMNEPSNFIASRIFPIVPVQNDSGQYVTFDKKYWFLDGLQHRAPGAPFPSVEYGVSSATYKTEQFAADYAIADEIRANSQVPLDLETVAVQFLGNLSLLRKEIAWASAFWTTGVWGTDNTSATDWDDFTSGDPVGDVLAAKDVIATNTGYQANTLVVGRPVHTALMNHPDVIDRVKHTSQANQPNISAALASMFGVSRYLVGNASYSNTNEAAAFSGANIFDDDALLLYVNEGAGLFDASAGKTFVWGPGGGVGSLYRYREDSRHADVIQHKEQWDQKVTAADLGYFWSDIV